MKKAASIVFRRMTPADFFNISKGPGAETGGGGQSYIDIDVSGVSLGNWRSFFHSITEIMMTGGPAWDFDINSLGLTTSQQIRIGQRRVSSVSIRSQKLHSSASKRVHAWHPSHTYFPSVSSTVTNASDPIVTSATNNLVIYIVKDTNEEYWAGWFKSANPKAAWQTNAALLRMFSEGEGYIEFDAPIDFDEADGVWAFRPTGSGSPTTSATLPTKKKKKKTKKKVGKKTKKSGYTKRKKKKEKDVIKELFDDDLANESPALKKQTVKLRKRNAKAVKVLKSLYKECQITGTEFIFDKTNGDPYTEAHHLIPLGEGGADSPENLVVVSAHIHKMLHYADVEGLDLTKISDNKLDISINGDSYTITWHPKHAELVTGTKKIKS